MLLTVSVLPPQHDGEEDGGVGNRKPCAGDLQSVRFIKPILVECPLISQIVPYNIGNWQNTTHMLAENVVRLVKRIEYKVELIVDTHLL